MAELPETAQEEFDALPLKEALRRLPKDLRDVIILRYFTGLTLEETAQALDTSRLLHSGRAVLLRIPPGGCTPVRSSVLPPFCPLDAQLAGFAFIRPIPAPAGAD